MTNVQDFGTTASGTPVQRITLAAGDLTVSLLKGTAQSLTIGTDDLALYEGAFRHHGTLIGPVVNRITGASASIDGTTHHFTPDPGDDLILHSGPAGTHRKVWELADHSASHATLTLILPDGEGGFPGNRHVTATYRVTEPAILRLKMAVTTDKATLINFANHSYWNLDGTADWFGHTLSLAADRYLPATAVFTPTGQIKDLAGSAYDFRRPRQVAKGTPALDTNFCLAGARRPLTDVLTLTGQSGRSLTLATTEPGLQLYDGRAAGAPGHPDYQGLAIEAQLWPDAPGHAEFPSITLAPGQVYAPTTEWRFG